MIGGIWLVSSHRGQGQVPTHVPHIYLAQHYNRRRRERRMSTELPSSSRLRCPATHDPMTVCIPKDFSKLKWTCGLSGVIIFVSETHVIKKPLTDETSQSQLDVECRIYERLGPHPQITEARPAPEQYIVLERLQGTLRHRLLGLRSNDQRPGSRDVIRWGLQAAKAMQHIHSRGVKQVDIGTYNALLDSQGNLKLSDFAGSSLDGSEPTVAPSAHSTHPRLSTLEPSLESELFALGSMLYEIETTFQPYHDKNDEELEQLFGADEYPDTSNLVLGEMIRKCWMAHYQDAGELVVDIESRGAALENMTEM